VKQKQLSTLVAGGKDEKEDSKSAILDITRGFDMCGVAFFDKILPA